MERTEKPDRKDRRTPRARALRRAMTPPEKRVWALLSQPPFDGFHFRRQAPIGPYFADFASHGTRLVVEIDGDSHHVAGAAERDAVRTAFLEAAGYRLVRIPNSAVAEGSDGVFELVKAGLEEYGLLPLLDPSPR